MTGPNVDREDSSSPPTSAWCTSTSVGNTVFEFTWNIADYQRKKESVKRDDSIQSSTFTVQANSKKSRWYLTFLPNGAAEEEENDTDHEEAAQEDEEEISIHGDVAVYLYQVSAYENYVNSLKFKISFLNPRNGDKMLVYDHGYGKKYRYHDSWGWGICDILVPSEFINDDTLTIVCEMTIPGNDVTRLGYTYNDAKSHSKKEESNKLVTDMEHLLETSTLTDVTIKCENQTLECHKAILSARSNVFHAMFQHDMRESKNNEIIISDLDFSTVKDMVKFIYSGRLADIAEKSDLLLSAADKYDIKDLKDICCQCLSSNLNVEQIVDVLVLSDLHKATDLKNTAIQFLLCHKEEVFAQPDWKIKLKGHPDLLLEVLESSVESRGCPPPNKRRRRK